MAWTQANIDALKTAIATGHLRVTYGDKTIQYQDTASMLRALKAMEAEVGAYSSNNGRTIMVQHGRGI